MKKAKKCTPKPGLVDTIELCKDLVAMAGLLGNSRVEKKIYQAVRQLQLLDQAAKRADAPK